MLNAGRRYLGVENLSGKVFVTSGLGGMSGAQAKAAVIAGCVGIIAEVSLCVELYSSAFIQVVPFFSFQFYPFILSPFKNWHQMSPQSLQQTQEGSIPICTLRYLMHIFHKRILWLANNEMFKYYFHIFMFALLLNTTLNNPFISIQATCIVFMHQYPHSGCLMSTAGISSLA